MCKFSQRVAKVSALPYYFFIYFCLGSTKESHGSVSISVETHAKVYSLSVIFLENKTGEVNSNCVRLLCVKSVGRYSLGRGGYLECDGFYSRWHTHNNSLLPGGAGAVGGSA